MKHRIILLAITIICVCTGQAAGQTSEESVDESAPRMQPSVVDALLGEWTGTGALFGRPASYSMRWTRDDAGFVHLSFSNSFVGKDGRRTPVLAARAVYRLTDSTGTGVWIDDRPQRITIEARVTDSSLVSNWSAASERGRTEYYIAGPDSVRVLDFVENEGDYRQFGSAAYTRKQ